jgi:hypothetical protein
VHGSPVILLRDGSLHLISDENYPAIFLIIGSCAVLLSVNLLIIEPLTKRGGAMWSVIFLRRECSAAHWGSESAI